MASKKFEFEIPESIDDDSLEMFIDAFKMLYGPEAAEMQTIRKVTTDHEDIAQMLQIVAKTNGTPVVKRRRGPNRKKPVSDIMKVIKDSPDPSGFPINQP